MPTSKPIYILRYPALSISFLLMLFFACRNHDSEMASRSSVSDTILDSANAYLNAGELSKSLSYLDSAYGRMSNQGSIDRWKRLNFLNNFYLHYRVDLDRAGGYADSMALVLEDYKDRYPEAYSNTLFAQGDVLRGRKQWSAAFEHYYRGRTLAKERLDTCLWTVFTNRLGLIRYGQKQYLQAVGYFKQALAEQRTCSELVDFELSFVLPQSIYNNIALSYEKAGRVDSALYFYRQGINYVEKGRLRFPDRSAYIETALGVFNGNLGGTYLKMGNLISAEPYLVQSVALNDRKGYAREDALTARKKLVQLYLASGRLNLAEEHLNQITKRLTQVESENGAKRKLELELLRLKAELAERQGNPALGLSLWKRYQLQADSLAITESQSLGSDMEASFRLAAQSNTLELSKRDSQLRLFYLLAAVLLLILVGIILWMVWKNLKRSNIQVNRLEQALRVLEQSRLENKRMVRIAAHDLRNPLSAIQLLSQMTLEQEDLSEEMRKMLQIVSRSSQQSLALVGNMLDAGAKQEVERKEEDLLQVLQFCVEQLRPRAKEKQVSLVLKGSALKALINAEHLWRVVGNLLDNAIKFSPIGGMVTVQLQAKENTALISVADQGIGIPSEIGEKLFILQETTGRAGTAGEASHGIGLTVAKQLIEARGGKIWHEPNSVIGTIFFVELPVLS